VTTPGRELTEYVLLGDFRSLLALSEWPAERSATSGTMQLGARRFVTALVEAIVDGIYRWIPPTTAFLGGLTACLLGHEG
jgi:hypothetical protein